VPGVTEENALAEISSLLEQHLVSPHRLPAVEPGHARRRRVRRRPCANRTRSRASTPSTSRDSASRTRRTPSLIEDVDLLSATPGGDINWLEDIKLLQEDGMPAVFDRYSNSFLKIHFPIPRARRTTWPARC
jgi:hypothetical protein